MPPGAPVGRSLRLGPAATGEGRQDAGPTAGEKRSAPRALQVQARLLLVLRVQPQAEP